MTSSKIETLPDGSVFDGVFYTFMVDCPTCGGDPYMHDLGDGFKPPRCSGCDNHLQVRNPALEWRCAQWGHVHWSSSLLRGSSPYVDECLLVAVGVKETE